MSNVIGWELAEPDPAGRLEENGAESASVWCFRWCWKRIQNRNHRILKCRI